MTGTCRTRFAKSPMRSFDPSLAHYFRALSGRACELVAYDDHDPWPHPDTASTVRLPRHPPVEDFYLVALAHRALHHTLGTFTLSPSFFARSGLAFVDGMPALEQFIRCFGRTALAIEVFAVLEDLRVDAHARGRFAGLRASFSRVQRHALSTRPSLATLPPRSAVAEALVQFSLGASAVWAPPSLSTPLAQVISVASTLSDPHATVESTAEATIRVYGVLARLPNVGVRRTLRSVSFSSLPRVDVAAEFRAELRLEGDEFFDVRLAPVHYRDAPGPRYAGQTSSGMPLQEAILRLTPRPPAEPTFLEKSEAAERGGPSVEQPPAPLPHDHGPDLDGHDELASGHLHRDGPDTFLYPEWDTFASRYRPDWCRLRVGRPRAGGPPVDSLRRYGHLLPSLVQQLERVRPAGRDFVHRMPSGDDLDLDACVEAMVDLRAGVQPSDRVHVSVRERRRDVAVAFALDLSASTAERRPGAGRILDLQRDAVSLLVEALERVGDAYGIYGFSGGGRDDVRLSVVKDLPERRSPAMLHRLAGLAPDHTTRMGPPIRHLTSILDRSEASTKILLIVSDGRPYDLDYGQQYGDDAVLTYAVADTARALDEARGRRRPPVPDHGRPGRRRRPGRAVRSPGVPRHHRRPGSCRRRWPSCTWSPVRRDRSVGRPGAGCPTGQAGARHRRARRGRRAWPVPRYHGVARRGSRPVALSRLVPDGLLIWSARPAGRARRVRGNAVLTIPQ